MSFVFRSPFAAFLIACVALSGAKAQFAPAVVVPTTASGFAATADLDGDGDDDGLVLAGTPHIATYINALPASLLQGPFIPVAQTPIACVTGDVDGDGDSDIISVGASTFSVVRIQGGSIIRTDYPHAASTPTPPRLLDFDGDGDLDLILGFQWYCLNNGAGAFGTPIALPSAFKEMADLDGDGDLDGVLTIVTFNNPAYRYETTLEIWLQSSPGIFTRIQVLSPAQTLIDEYVTRVAIADVNGDGQQDILLAGIWDGADMVLLSGVGAGFVTFTQWIALAIGGATGTMTPIRTADLDNDGFRDVTVGIAGFGGTLYHYRGSSTGLVAGISGVSGSNSSLGYASTLFIRGDTSGGLDMLWFSGNQPNGTASLRLSTTPQGTPPALSTAIVSGAAQSAVVGRPYAAPLVVRVRTPSGVPVANQSVSFTPASGSANPPVALTDNAGYAQTTVTAGQTGGFTTVLIGVLGANDAAAALFESGLFVTSAPQGGGTTDYTMTFRYPSAGVPLVLAADLPLAPPGFVSTPYGPIATSILNPSPTFVALDGLGLFGPPNPALVTGNNWSMTNSVTTAPLAGLTVVLQVYAFDVARPFPQSIIVTNPVSITF